MSFIVQEMPRAKADKRAIVKWLADRSKQGAKSWLDAYDEMISRLHDFASSYGFAIENPECEFAIRQAIFKTRHGRRYRAVFFIETDTVYVLRVRGPAQAPINPADLEDDINESPR